MKLIKELNEAKRSNFTNSVTDYYGKGFDPKTGFIKGGGMYSNNWSREDMLKAVEQVQTTKEFKDVEKRMKFISTAQEIKNGTLAFQSDVGNTSNSSTKTGKGNVVLVYLGGQIRTRGNQSGNFNRQITRVKSPKPHFVAGDPVKSAVETYKNALKEVAARYDRIKEKDRKAVEKKYGSDPMGKWYGRNESLEEAVAASSLSLKDKPGIMGFIYDQFKGKDLDEVEFDFPDYGGLPKKINSKLSSEFVDAVQDCLVDIDTENRSTWIKHVMRVLRGLGESQEINEENSALRKEAHKAFNVLYLYLKKNPDLKVDPSPLADAAKFCGKREPMRKNAIAEDYIDAIVELVADGTCNLQDVKNSLE